MPDNSKSAAIYCRISRDFGGEGVGVERQEKDCRDLAARLGLNVERVYVDNDVGASEKTRKSKVRVEFEEMLDEVRKGNIKYVVAYSNSRLTRRMAELEIFVGLSNTHKLRVHTVVSGDDDLSTADGLMTARIKASVDAGESHRISERSKASFRHKAMSGEPRVTSHRPFGWMADGKTLDPFESELIREGVQDLIRGVPLNVIRKRWEEAEIKTPSGATVWHWSNVQSILTSWRTVGVRTYNNEVLMNNDGTPVQGLWEPIVSMADREAALAQMSKRTVKRTKNGLYLLSGLLRCECGRRVWGNIQRAKGKASQYACSAPNRHVSIDADKLEKLVVKELFARLANREIESQNSVSIPDSSVWVGEPRLNVVVSKISELMDAFNSDQLSGTIVFPRVEALEAERNVLQDERADFLASQSKPRRQLQDGNDVAEFIKELDNLPWSELHTILKQETDAIVISKGVRGVQSRTDEAFAARVHIVWREF